MPNNITPSADETPLPRIHKPLAPPLNCARNPKAQGKRKPVDRECDDVAAVKKMTAWVAQLRRDVEASNVH